MVLWDKVFKSGLSEFCELGLGLGCLPKNLLNQLLNTLSHTCITEEERKQFYSNATVQNASTTYILDISIINVTFLQYHMFS